MDYLTSKRSTLLRVFGTLLAFALLIYLLSQQGWEEIWAAVRQITLWRLALAFCLMLISRLAVTARWHVLLRASDCEISLWQSLRITFAGLFASNFLPTTIGGDVIRLAGAIQLKLDNAVSAASLVVDRLVGMAGMAMALPLGLPGLFSAGNSPTDAALWLTLTAAVPQKTWTKTVLEKGIALLRRVAEALKLWLKQPRALLLALLFSWLHMLCLFAIIHQLLTGMGENLSIWLIAGLYSLVYFVTLLPISVNGYGLQEVSMTFALSALGGASVSGSLTTALLFRTMMMLASTPGAAFVPGMLAYRSQSPEKPDTTRA